MLVSVPGTRPARDSPLAMIVLLSGNNMQQKITLRIVLENPPAGVDFGLQKGGGSHYETIQTQRSRAKDLSFEFDVAVKSDRKEPVPHLAGPFVQGPPGQRFVYIDIGTYAGQTETVWSRRLKVPLSGITWDIVDELSTGSKLALETRVPGTGKDGGPTCGAVKPLSGWKLKR